MEENVALDSTKQKQFVKSIKGIKNLIKDNAKGVTGKLIKAKGTTKGPVKKYSRKPRGLVYLAHIPHGFYENEMTQYFKQFGMVTNVRVIRSKLTGASRGFGFVEFRDPAVGQIVAETMNNYLMGKRLIKAEYVPPENQRIFAKRKHWNASNNPTQNLRLKLKKENNAIKDDTAEYNQAKSLLATFRRTNKKLGELGVNYNFFAPVDVPEALKDKLTIPEVIKTKSISKKGGNTEAKKPGKVLKLEKKIQQKKVNKDKVKKEVSVQKVNKKSMAKKNEGPISNKKDVPIVKKSDGSVVKTKKVPIVNNKKIPIVNKIDDPIAKKSAGPIVKKSVSSIVKTSEPVSKKSEKSGKKNVNTLVMKNDGLKNKIVKKKTGSKNTISPALKRKKIK